MGGVNISHGELNDREELHARSKGSKRILVTPLASALMVGAVIFLAVGVEGHDNERAKDVRTNRLGRGKSTSNAVNDGCSSTLHPELCVSSLCSFGGLSSEAGPMEIVNDAVSVDILAVEKAKAHLSGLSRVAVTPRQLGALQDCIQLFDLTLSDLEKSLLNVSNSNSNFLAWRQAFDVETWLSAALTNQATCLEGFQEASGGRQISFSSNLRNVSRLLSNSLALVKNISVVGRHHNRRLLSEEGRSNREEFPSWLSSADRRRLLQDDTSDNAILADSVLTVAQDGTGNYTTINEAIGTVPNNSLDRYVIYVTEGVYEEYVEIPSYKTNIMLLGDGINATVITGNRSVVDGWTTFHSATVAVVGAGFLARDITFENTAGPDKHQAVALRVGSDLSAFYRCSFLGYQDTLYVHSFRQFYRECDIYGTVDFIFGNAAVVFQSCNLLARKPMANQQNTFTAQGRSDPNQNTGISIQNCNVSAAPDLVAVKSSFETYLGRPWREYSRTVYINSFIDDVVHPRGWLEWLGNQSLSTLYYGEYMNWGAGAGTAARVQWPGYHIMNISDALNFTVANFISADTWLNTVPFTSGLA
ncbi:pectinesterase-like isoform X2 [Cryptomeria japonica]|uniref:pectinesterase-like isoform X2 n=1 Tax=Cryptomeria japonica TaxID=3369 RepID=UPI0025AC1797|nr:pectinesterase-like isoform X2 [Cryptomeria japonica]